MVLECGDWNGSVCLAAGKYARVCARSERLGDEMGCLLA